MIRIFIDGAANPKKQQSGIGAVLIDNGQQLQLSKSLTDYYDNHETELIALQYVLDYLLESNKQDELIFCHSDSKMLVDAVNKRYSRKENHMKHLNLILTSLKKFSQFYLKWVPERDNRGADQLARVALNK
ncbi:ribonuclease HI family protein [Jeotgalibaca dankookensis]|uniref:ribonuclease HI family protein n=1 Tax=Jeotgalibaca dankookensis TaxID=708126 RepID=UPI00078292D8|nr:ribonuclease HI family protein [Jeotgalibaca dankookensis]